MDFLNMLVHSKCPCGKVHKASIDKIIIEKGAITLMAFAATKDIRAKYPENTRNSYEAVLDIGVDAFKYDV